MAAFNGVDFLRFDDLLTEEEKTIRQAVRDWVEEKFLPLIEHHYEAATFPAELIPEIAELGLLGANLPDEYGCAGISNVAYGLIMQELERGDSGLRSFASVQGALVMYPIFAFGSEEQKRALAAEDGQRRDDRLLRPDRARLRLEPRRHDDDGARRDGDGCVLNGAKMWITNGTLADVAIVWAQPRRRQDPRLPRRERARRASRRPSRRASSRCAPRSRASSSSQDVHVAPDAILPRTARASRRRSPA